MTPNDRGRPNQTRACHRSSVVVVVGRPSRYRRVVGRVRGVWLGYTGRGWLRSVVAPSRHLASLGSRRGHSTATACRRHPRAWGRREQRSRYGECQSRTALMDSGCSCWIGAARDRDGRRIRCCGTRMGAWRRPAGSVLRPSAIRPLGSTWHNEGLRCGRAYGGGDRSVSHHCVNTANGCGRSVGRDSSRSRRRNDDYSGNARRHCAYALVARRGFGFGEGGAPLEHRRSERRTADLAPRRSVLGVSLAARPRSGHSCGWRLGPAVAGAGPRTGLGARPQFLCEQPTR
jgi:hypothetical protein